ncbi:glycosyltransferase [Aeromonas veronii]
MKKIILSHFPYTGSFSNGVINYTKAVHSVTGSDYEIIYKQKDESQATFRNRIARSITFSFNKSNTLIESAESQASTLLLPRDFNVHIRMHCPFYLYKNIIKEEPDEQRYSEEIRAMYKAKAVSSPSYGMLELLKDDLDINNIHVFKNPVDLNNVDLNERERDIDVIFILRFNRLKGSEYINPILRLLPEKFNVLLIGKQEEKFHLDSRVRCKVTILDHVEGAEKFNLLKRSKVSISLSKFENCSMVILESIGVGTPVVCWNVGGSPEIAPPPIISAVDYEDVFLFSRKIQELVSAYGTSLYPQYIAFQKCITALNNDFISGVKHIEANIQTLNSVYKGITFKGEHSKIKHIPYELINESWSSLENRPIKYIALTNTSECAERLSIFFKKNSKNITIYSRQLPYNATNNIKSFNWLSKLGELLNLIKEDKPDVILVEDPAFSNEIKKNAYIQKLGKPTAFIKTYQGGVLFDRFGWGSDSYLSQRAINSGMPSVISNRINGDYNVLVVGDANTPSKKCVMENIRKFLSKKHNLKKTFVNIEMDYSDPFFTAISANESSVREKNITDIIYLDDFMCCEHLRIRANIYYVGTPTLLKNKNIGVQIDPETAKLNPKIIFEHERDILCELLKTKTLTIDSDFNLLNDEVIPVLNRSSYKRHYY